MKRRLQAIGGLLLFVAGTLLIPAMHKWELSCTHACTTGGAFHGCCSHDHSFDRKTHGHSRESEPAGKHHDPSTCPICQLDKMPAFMPAVGIPVPQFEPVEIAFPVAPRQPAFKTPRLLPFFRGPPA